MPFVWPALLALVATPLAALSVAGPAAHRWLDYERQPLADGQWWRLLSAHVMHLSPGHAVLDIVALLLVAWIFGSTLRPSRQGTVVVVAALWVDASLWWLHPEVDRYVGLSGVLHGWFVSGCTLWLFERGPGARRGERRLWGALLLAAVAIKLVLEVDDAPFWLTATDLPVVTAAHRAGASAGLLCGLAWALVSRRAASVASRGRPRTG